MNYLLWIRSQAVYGKTISQSREYIEILSAQLTIEQLAMVFIAQ